MAGRIEKAQRARDTPAMTSLRVASYNIRKCMGLDRRRDPERVLSVIAALGADAVALQEADRRLGERPATLERARIAEVTGLVAVDLAANDISLGWHGNAVLLHPGIRVTEVRRLELPGLEPRGAVLVHGVRDDSAFRLVAVHLGLTRAYRRRQLNVIVKAMAGADLPTVILGDMNEWRNDRGLEPLAPGFAVHSPGLSFHAARPVAALDRIAVTRSVKVERTGVHRADPARVASDHLPVWADLRLR
jgi:endonuclease/exonuclease/phosphatase family metal-dependent hydrolase